MFSADKLYRIRFSTQRALEAKDAVWNVLCRHFFQSFIPSDATVIDPAAGYCEFINHIKAGRKIAFDLNPDSRRFFDPSVEFYQSSILTSDVPSCDIFFVSNFLEHLENRQMVFDIFSAMFRALRVNGKVLILQPNIRLIGDAYWDFIDHKVPLTEKSITEVAQMTGFCLQHCITRFLPYTTKSFFPKSPFLTWLFVRLMPVSGWLFGKQSFFVFCKEHE